MSGSIPNTPNSVSVDRSGPGWLVASSGYELLGRLSQPVSAEEAQPGRSEIQVGIARSARSLEQMVVLKRFHDCPPDADWLQLVAELEFATLLQHENVVRTLGIGLEAGRYFAVQEYLEGATLDALLRSCAATQAQLPHAAVVRILLSILDAVKYADLMASAGQPDFAGTSRALARAFLAVDDVFITCDGHVKLLGFKGTHARPCPTQAPAIDALLQQQLTPELRRAFPRLARAANDGVADPTEEIRRVLCSGSPIAGSPIAGSPIAGSPAGQEDGRAELTMAMRQVLRKERAQQALRLAKEFARLRGPVRRPPPHAGEEEAAPASGYRRIAPRESSVSAPFGLVRPQHR
jgi:hypothetical protein